MPFARCGGKVEAEFADNGEQSLRNIARPLRVFSVRSASAPEPRGAPAASLLLPDKPSIAVLPFTNMSGDPEQEYFADGIVEEIITALSRVRWFFVIARNSCFTYKGRAVNVKQVGRELGVRYVLEGSVRKSGNRMRITAQLAEAATGNHVWAERYDRDLADIFAVQDEITERVVAAIEPELYSAERFRSQRKTPESLDAWECVIRALSLISQDTHARNTEAEALCRRAIEISPGYGQAHSLFAWVITRRTLWSGDVTTVAVEANTAVRTALDLDERDPWAHLVHGMVLWRMRRHADAVRAYRRALELNPSFALAHALLGLPLAAQGLHEGAVSSAGNALRLSPSDRLVDRYASGVMVVAAFAAGEYRQGTRGDREIPGGARGLHASCCRSRHAGAARRGGRSAGRVAPRATRFLACLGERQHSARRGNSRAPSRRSAQGGRARGVSKPVSLVTLCLHSKLAAATRPFPRMRQPTTAPIRAAI